MASRAFYWNFDLFFHFVDSPFSNQQANLMVNFHLFTAAEFLSLSLFHSYSIAEKFHFVVVERVRVQNSFTWASPERSTSIHPRSLHTFIYF